LLLLSLPFSYLLDIQRVIKISASRLRADWNINAYLWTKIKGFVDILWILMLKKAGLSAFFKVSPIVFRLFSRVMAFAKA